MPVGLGVSMAIWDDDLHTALEPGVPTPRARLDLVRALTDAGLPCGVFLAPVLPGLTDDAASWTPRSARSPRPAPPASPSSRCTCGRARASGSWPGCAGAHPELVPRYEQLYARRAYVPAEYRTWLQQQVAPLLTKHGLDRQSGGSARGASDPIATGVPGDEEVGFPAGSLPSGGMPGVRPKSEVPRGPAVGPVPGDDAEQLSLI